MSFNGFLILNSNVKINRFNVFYSFSHNLYCNADPHEIAPSHQPFDFMPSFS